MEKQNAWVALFSQQVPTSVDLDEAADALEGEGEISPGVQLEKAVQDRANEFLTDPSTFVAANQTDPRVPQWTRLAASLESPVGGGSPAPVAQPSPITASATGAPATSPPMPAARGLSTSALTGARVGSTTPSLQGLPAAKGTGASHDDADAPPTREKKKKKKKKKKKRSATDRTDSEDGSRAPTPLPEPIAVFDEMQDGTRTTGELTRESAVAAGRVEKPAALKKRHDAEAIERQRRFDQDAVERTRRRAEEAAERVRRRAEKEEARKRRMADEVEADELKRQAELRLANEKRRLDREAAQEQRLADEDAAERKCIADERAQERALARKEAAEERKRQADEAARLASKALEQAAAVAAAAPPAQSRARHVHPDIRATLASEPYLIHRDEVLDLVSHIRGDNVARAQLAKTNLDKLIGDLQAQVRAMPSGYLVMASAQLLLSMIGSLESRTDVKDPVWFQANYVTGKYV